MNKSDIKAGFLGDSIFYGYQTEYEFRCWKVFEKESGIKVISSDMENPLGFPGAGIFDLNRLFDSLFMRYCPDLVFLCVGANHFDSNGNLMWPYGVKESVFFDEYKKLFEKLISEERLVVWAGIPPLEAGGLKQEKALEWSFKIGEEAKSFGCETAFFTEAIIQTKDWDAMGGSYYGNLALDIHPNEHGQAFIGHFFSDYIKKNEKLLLAS